MQKIVFLSFVFIAILVVSLSVGIAQVDLPIYPQWANKITRSNSMQKVEITLATGIVEKGKFIPAKNGEARRLAQLSIPRAYVDWKPYLKGKPISSMHIDAALPDLVPNVTWKQDYLDSKRDSNGNVEFQYEKSAHQQWVRIDFGLYGFSNSMCEAECSREEHNKKVMEYYLGKYDQFVSSDSIGGLKLFISSSESGDVRGHKFYVPIDQSMGHLFIDCGRSLGHYQWCKASTILNNDMFLRYQFEQKHIATWKEIHLKAKALVNQLLISHETEI